MAPACLSEEVKFCIGCGRCLFCNDCEEKIDPDGCLDGGHALKGLLLFEASALSGEGSGGCCLTAHPRIYLEKLVLRSGPLMSLGVTS